MLDGSEGRRLESEIRAAICAGDLVRAAQLRDELAALDATSLPDTPVPPPIGGEPSSGDPSPTAPQRASGTEAPEVALELDFIALRLFLEAAPSGVQPVLPMPPSATERPPHDGPAPAADRPLPAAEQSEPARAVQAQLPVQEGYLPTAIEELLADASKVLVGASPRDVLERALPLALRVLCDLMYSEALFLGCRFDGSHSGAAPEAGIASAVPLKPYEQIGFLRKRIRAVDPINPLAAPAPEGLAPCFEFMVRVHLFRMYLLMDVIPDVIPQRIDRVLARHQNALDRLKAVFERSKHPDLAETSVFQLHKNRYFTMAAFPELLVSIRNGLAHTSDPEGPSWFDGRRIPEGPFQQACMWKFPVALRAWIESERWLCHRCIAEPPKRTGRGWVVELHRRSDPVKLIELTAAWEPYVSHPMRLVVDSREMVPLYPLQSVYPVSREP